MIGTFRKRQSSGNNLSENMKLVKTFHNSKENIPSEINAAINSVDNKTSYQDVKTEITTPKKIRINLEEPVTPSTNFKLLTSLAATLDYADCDIPKLSKNEETTDNQMSCDPDMSDLSTGKVNRKEKSLAIICTRFLSMYPTYPPPGMKIIVSLDEACLTLGVERRRLYDIVNVFEGLDILTKNAKNQYLWFGKNNLLESLHKLRTAAIKENMLDKLLYVLKSECGLNCKQSCILNRVQSFNKSIENTNSPVSSTQEPLPEGRKEKSLGIMSQKFLMLFLVSPNKIISLGMAVKVLNGFFQRNEKGAQIKTQIRRLYDIANVLSSIGLIQKEAALAEYGRKPAFKYIGPDLKDETGVLTNLDKPALQPTVKSDKSRSLVRHSSFQDICAVAEIEHKKLNLNESHNSAPPFDSALTDKKDAKTNFENLQLNDNIKSTKKNTDIEEIKPRVKPQLLMKSNLKFINLAKSVANSTVPYIIVNNVAVEKSDSKLQNSSYGTQTFLLINTITPSKEVKAEPVDNKPVNKVSSPQTIILSSEQRDAILQSLNISLSPEQVAAIYLDGAPQLNNSVARSNVLKITNKNNTTRIIDSKATQKEFESNTNGSSSTNNTRNNSPSGMQASDSPLSIPSGYVTPIPNVSSDISFVSNVEVNDILKKIESQSNFDILNTKINTSNTDNIKICNSAINSEVKAIEHNRISFQNSDTREKLLCNNYPINTSNNNNEIYSTNQINQLISNDSCSSDSVNLELSNIFKGKTLGDISVRSKPFLIDEKTLLSPIKTFNAPVQISAPSNLITPSCTVPETVFVFNPPVSYQTTGVSDTSSCVTSVPNFLPDNKKKTAH